MGLVSFNPLLKWAIVALTLTLGYWPCTVYMRNIEVALAFNVCVTNCCLYWWLWYEHKNVTMQYLRVLARIFCHLGLIRLQMRRKNMKNRASGALITLAPCFVRILKIMQIFFSLSAVFDICYAVQSVEFLGCVLYHFFVVGPVHLKLFHGLFSVIIWIWMLINKSLVTVVTVALSFTYFVKIP